jgi:glycosyltransferase involved in cell wall biosynthesis
VIGVSLLTLVPGEVGGSETYVRELLRALGRVGEHEYRVVVPPVARDAGEGLPTEVASEYRAARTVPARLAAMAAATARPGVLRRRLAQASVVHYPLTLRIPRVDRPSVVTLHDVQHLDLPAMFSRAERAFRRLAWHPSILKADRVIVISEFVRERAIEKLGVASDRIRVVHSGVDHATFVPGDRPREDFILYPARAWPHKNHARLFEAFAVVRRERPSLRLVLTGGGDVGTLPAGVEARGHVATAELAALYASAAALVFPSLYEGFGQPPLEAMASGCPVACSRSASLPEIVGDAAWLFDALDPADIAAAILGVLEAPEPWVERGLARAARFSWDETARRTDAVYAELL